MAKSKYWLYQRFLHESQDPDSIYFDVNWVEWHNHHTCYAQELCEQKLLKYEQAILEKINLVAKENIDDA